MLIVVAQTVKNLPAVRETSVPISGLGGFPGEGNGNPPQYLLTREFHGQRSLVGLQFMGL